MHIKYLKCKIYKLLIFFAFIICQSTQSYAEEHLKIATFDSGFGGYFTAQAITQVAAKIAQQKDAVFSIEHFGDTANAPYGEKTPEQIAALTTRGVSKLLEAVSELTNQL